jgi:CheY-like chemotaxis protein/HPt (histidine-containing phosphotransfer) domain-containing protein
LDGVRLLPNPSGAVETRASVPTTLALPVLNHRVLVVDDGDTNRKLIQLVLGRAGARVEAAENGLQAVSRATTEPFDLILMDMQMPIMDGYTATAELRARGVTVPIIALTANAMKWDEARCLAAGCSGYLSKPIDQDLLLVTVAAALGAKGSPTPPATPPVTARPAVAPLPGKLVSTLPTEDPDFRAVVAHFAQRLQEQIPVLHDRLAAGDLPDLAALSHWLKGTGGTAGFPAFTEPASLLERLARSGHTDGIYEVIQRLEQMAGQIVIE